MSYTRHVLLVVLSLLLCVCRGTRRENTDSRALVSVDKTVAKLGDEIHIRTDHVPKGWSGEIEVNSFHNRFALNSALYGLRVTRKNGFTKFAPTNLFISLKDPSGREIPIANGGGWIRITIKPTVFQLEPESSEVSAEGGVDQIRVTAPHGAQWTPRGLPDWVRLASNVDAAHETIRYTVAENASHQQRSATITIGDANFELTQWASPYVLIPFEADLTRAPIPVWELRPFTNDTEHTAPPWVLDDQSGLNASVTATYEGPDGSGSLVIEKPLPVTDAWKTQIWIPGINTQNGATYTVSIWLKAQNPSTVGLEFGRRVAPNHLCGLSKMVSVPSVWKKFTVMFRAEGEECGPEYNRFAIQAGTVFGKLWIANFSLTRE